jgi:exosome complex RNA-binding protein Rrp4
MNRNRDRGNKKNKSENYPNKIKDENNSVNNPPNPQKNRQAPILRDPNNILKILLFPGESFEFNEKLIHYDAFGYSNGNLISKRSAVLLCDKGGKPLDDNNEEIYRSVGKYYSPKVDDFVIGTIVQKSSEFYKVEINTYTPAILNTKDFEGATKKSKPNLNLGDTIFARVLKVNKFDAPILSCISQHSTKTWATGESYFGGLKNGNIFNFPKINTWDFYKDNYALKRLEDYVKFDISIGCNGKLWINSDSVENIFSIYEILISSIENDNQVVEKLIHEKFKNLIK